MQQIIKYGIRNKVTNKILGFETSSNEGGYACNSETYTLSEYSENIWSVKYKEQAQYVLEHSTEWYNAGYKTPNHNIDSKQINQYEIVEIITIVNSIPVSISSTKEMIELKYRESNPKHADFLLQELDNHPDMKFSWYDYTEVLFKNEEEK
jgi:hypothetical protein